eukprot:229132_1
MASIWPWRAFARREGETNTSARHDSAPLTDDTTEVVVEPSPMEEHAVLDRRDKREDIVVFALDDVRVLCGEYFTGAASVLRSDLRDDATDGVRPSCTVSWPEFSKNCFDKRLTALLTVGVFIFSICTLEFFIDASSCNRELTWLRSFPFRTRVPILDISERAFLSDIRFRITSADSLVIF